MSDEPLIKTPGVFGENGNFLLERELGRGGMGGVYMGRDKMLDRPVAVKVMLREYGDDPEFVKRFKSEAQSAARLIHPNIAQIFSFGISDGMPYIAMELVAGGSLDRLMMSAAGQTDIPRILKIGEQVAQALRCASDQGVVHGDIKPENILLDANGNAKIVDFGLAGMQKDTDEIWGTPYYIAPEKLKKEKIDYRADMYNLGGSLYHALTGVAPFEGADANEVVRVRFLGPARSMREIRPDIPEAVDELVLKMLALDPKDRFPTFEALLEEFKNVMSTGLTDHQDKPAEKPKAASAKGKVMMRRPGRKIVMKRPGAGSGPSAEPAEDGALAEAGEKPEEGEETSQSKMKIAKPSLSNGTDEDEEEGGNIGRKVLLTVVGSIVGIGAIVGGLVWYQVADKKARAEEKVAMISKNIASAREAIAATRSEAVKFEDKFTVFAAQATESCERFTKLFVEKVPEFAERFKPAPSAELLAAIALTNAPVVAAVGTNGVAGATNAVAAAAAPAAPAAAPAAGAIPRFRAPKDDESDPNSPEGQKYLEEKKAWEAEQKRLAEEKAKAKEAPKPAEAPAPAVEEKKEAVPLEKELQRIGEAAVGDMNDLWNRAYACQAAVIRIHVGIQKVLAECDKANALAEENEETMKALGALSGTALDLYNDIKGSKDVEAVKKGIGYIRSKGEKAVINTGNELFRKKAEDARRQKREAELKAAEERRQKQEEERQALIASEIEQAKAKFVAIQASGALNLLAWDSPLLQLKHLESNFKTAEGVQAIKDERLKVTDMQSVQKILVKNMKGYAFRKSKLGKEKARVVEANDTEFKVAVPAGLGKERMKKITWVKFYKEYHGNLNELLLQYVDNGRKNCKPVLSLREWSDAMCGAALIMRIICAEDASSVVRSEQIVKEVAKQYDQYLPVLKKMFPDIQFETDAAEE